MGKIQIETINPEETKIVPEQNKVQKGQLLWLGIVQKKGCNGCNIQIKSSKWMITFIRSPPLSQNGQTTLFFSLVIFFFKCQLFPRVST